MTIEGIPDGWEPVRYDFAYFGESYLGGHGEIFVQSQRQSPIKRLIIRKIEKPKRYRPFANAAEFEPFRDRWVRHKSNSDSCMRIDGYGNKGVTIQGCVHDFDEMLEDRTFDDGTPFGIEVTE